MIKRPLAQFESVETIKGVVPDHFTINNGFFYSGQPIPAQDFDSHTQLGFWEANVTRQWNMTDCVMRPFFLQDRTYLLFLDFPHWRGFEEVSAPEDLWLGAVRRLVANPELDTGLTLSAAEWLSMAHGIFLGEVSDCSGPTLGVNRVYSGEFEDAWEYTDDQDSRFSPLRVCTVGASFLVVTLTDETLPLLRKSARIFEVSGGVVDLSIRHGSEVEIAPTQIGLDAIEAALR